MSLTPKQAYINFALLFSDTQDIKYASGSIERLKQLAEAYGIDNIDSVEEVLRTKGNAKKVAKKLKKIPHEDLAVRVYGEIGFHLSTLASLVYEPDTGLEIAEPISDALGFLLVMEQM